MMKQTTKQSSATKLNPSPDVKVIAPPTGPGIFKAGDQVKVSLGARKPIHAYGVVEAVWSGWTNLIVRPKGRSPDYRGTWYLELVGDAASRRFSTFQMEQFGEDVCSIKADDAPEHFCDLVVTVLNGRKSKPAAKKGAR